MRRFRDIIEDIKAPSTQSLWLNNGELKVYGTEGWTPLNNTSEDIQELEEKVNSLDKEVGQIKKELSIDGEVSKISEFTLKDNSYTLPAATKTTIGGVKAGINIVDIANPDNATAPQVAGTLNTLLGQLRNAGILIS
jgi:hypothetical protein